MSTSWYQLAVEYRDVRQGWWQSSPIDDGDAARRLYADHCGYMRRGGIHQVVLMRDGVVVAKATS